MPGAGSLARFGCVAVALAHGGAKGGARRGHTAAPEGPGRLVEAPVGGPLVGGEGRIGREQVELCIHVSMMPKGCDNRPGRKTHSVLFGPPGLTAGRPLG